MFHAIKQSLSILLSRMAVPSRPVYFILITVVCLLSGFLFVALSQWRNTGTDATEVPTTGAIRESDTFFVEKNKSSVVYRPTRRKNHGGYLLDNLYPPIKPPAAGDETTYYLDPAVISKQYSINPEPCSKLPVQPFLVLIVFARPDGFKLRQAIRQTWGSLADAKCGVRVLFMFGRVYDSAIQNLLVQEGKKYGDVIQSNQFDDKYRAAANKAIHLLQWGGTFCPQSTYTAKIDDDNWLNVKKYLNFLKTHQDPYNVYGGLFGAGTTVIRDPNSKYYVPMEEFDSHYYPEYLSGILYAFPTKQLPKVVHIAKQLKTTFNDDVFVCGLVTTKAGLKRAEVPDYAWDHNIHDTTCSKRDKMCIHYSKIEDFYRLWNDPCYKYEKLC